MGYTTDFLGDFVLAPPLTQEQVKIVQDFSNRPHGVMTPWLAGFWCQWIVSDDGKIFEWNGREKFYDYIDWLHYLYYMFFSKWQVSMKGCIFWTGEDEYDKGIITATPFLSDDGMLRTTFTVESTEPTMSVDEKDFLMPSRMAVVGGPVKAADAQKVDACKAAIAGPGLEDLPMEMVARIACFMDVEDVMRFRAVCKLAYACSTSKKFVGQWCEQWKQKCRRFVVTVGEEEECNKLPNQFQFPMSQLVPAPGYVPVSASGGLICCCNGKKNSIMVGNPVTKQWLELPPCPLVKFSTWHLISYPDGGETGGMFFVVVDVTCKCWFNSKLSTWNLGEGVYNFVIASNLLQFGEHGKVYALVVLPRNLFGYVCEKGLVELDLEDVGASRLLCRWEASYDENETPFDVNEEAGIVLLEHKGKIVVKTHKGFWSLEQSSWSWELLLDVGDDELFDWRQLEVPRFCYELWVLPVDVTFASARMKMDVDKQCCASRYWASSVEQVQPTKRQRH